LISLPITHFAQADSGSSGLSAFNLNLKGFLFQLATFVIVLLVLRKWAVPKLIETIDKRQQTLEQSLENAKLTEEALAKAEARAEEILAKARAQADEALAEAKEAGTDIVAKAETAAGERAELIVKEAESRLSEEREKLHNELRAELADLVADATEKIIHEKLDEKRDMSLIDRAIKGITG
jgi:F-type H+-transporting ATPase subunit b